MKNHNDEAMQDYFASMLSDPSADNSETLVEDVQEQITNLQPSVSTLPDTLVFSEQEKATSPQKSGWKNLELGNEFQVLFFELGGVAFALPLTDLGGIQRLDTELNTLFGKPDWFSGVITHGDSLYNIVDTAKWINIENAVQPEEYTHYIILGTTEWGISCEKLLGTETLTADQVKWRKTPGKRPWLAGMVKEKMCALLHAEEFVKLLNSGINIQGH